MQAFLDGIGNALAAQSTAAQKCEALAQLSTYGIPEPVSRAATELLQREAASRVLWPFSPNLSPCCSVPTHTNAERRAIQCTTTASD